MMGRTSPELDALDGSDRGRDLLLLRLEEDLIGPQDPAEHLRELPTDRYLTGILFPPRTPIAAEEDEELGQGAEEAEETTGDAQEQVRLSGMQRPATAGLSFSVECEADPELRIRIRCGTYVAHHVGEDEELVEGSASQVHQSIWVRTDHDVIVESGALRVPYGQIALPGDDLPEGLEVHFQLARQRRGPVLLTVVLVNNHEDPGKDRSLVEERTLFQVAMEIRGAGKTRLVPRPSRRASQDEDDQIGALIYRSAKQYAVGHTCSAGWDGGDDDLRVFTTWIPTEIVPAMNANGGEAFAPLSTGSERPLSAAWLAEATDEDLTTGLAQLPDAYLEWLAAQERRIPDIEEVLQDRARKQIEICRAAAGRMHDTIGFLRADQDARRAFRLANQAMLLSRTWAAKTKDGARLDWRPFQLGFQLLSLQSVADRDHPDRDVMDLLWFPTGGGKTEAYLGLTAFLLFYRRLVEAEPDRGAGTALIMRYTLRALTIQQFQRAAALVMACEVIRRREDDSRFGTVAFSIGLWVGGGATPNKVKEATEIGEGSDTTHKQLAKCPCCNKQLRWKATSSQDRMEVRCTNQACELSAGGRPLPIWTIDEDIYREVPAVVIGTVDKFAQLARNESVGRFFGHDGAYAPPDVILQDELHLISGPLGTIAGLYEIAIDHLCSVDGKRPKIIGSTATIRRAQDQVRNLFNRQTSQFPPPVLDYDDSCFATVDTSAPGRRYAAITTAGRSPKFTLQAVSASLLQSALDPALADDERDHYATMLVYFNSLRELGGALILMQDDVNATIEAYAMRRGCAPRELEAPEELTSRKSAREIRDLLDILADGKDAPEVLLASNMISVGVDIERLGLMVVNGQPKTTAEYIQSTSRVGRGATPGLVVGVYNNARVRDRSHYETFKTWHGSLYREVEATSVTPFASRALDKALHAVLVCVGRHAVDGLRIRPTMTAENLAAMQALKDVILRRVAGIDRGESEAVEAAIDDRLARWMRRGPLDEYWVDHGKKKKGLMISAEQFAALRASGEIEDERWPTPNSMRDVEPSVSFKLGFPPRRAASGHATKDQEDA